MNDPFLSKEDSSSRWREQLSKHAVDLRIKRVKPREIIAPVLKKKLRKKIIKKVTREQILREMAILEEYDSRLAAQQVSLVSSVKQERVEPKYTLLPGETQYAVLDEARTWQSSAGFPAKAKQPAFAPKRKKLSRSIFSLFLVGLLVVIGVWGFGVWERASMAEAHVREQSPAGYAALIGGMESADSLSFKEAEEYFKEAHDIFTSVLDNTEIPGSYITSALSFLPVSIPGVSDVYIAQTAASLALAGKEASMALRMLLPLPDSDDILVARTHFSKAQSALSDVESRLSRIQEEDIPIDFRSEFFSAYSAIVHTNSSLAAVFSYGENILGLLGNKMPRTYLIVFQDPAEIRPTGGLIHTYGVFALFAGEVSDIQIQDVYSVDRQLTVNVVPPYPISHISTAWSMHDANWFADFPTSAEKIMWFYEKSGGVTADGVIAVTLPKDQSKDVIASFVRFNEMNQMEKTEFFEFFYENLLQKKILLYARDQVAQSLFESNGWSGSVGPTDENHNGAISDISSVVFANLGGYAVSNFIDTKHENIIQIKEDSSIHNTVKITRTYREGESTDPSIEYIRIYAPLGSRLVAAAGFSDSPKMPDFDYASEGFSVDKDVFSTGIGEVRDPVSGTDIFEESGLQVFGNWLVLRPGETETAEIQYVLPFTLEHVRSYSLNIFSQPGISVPHSIIIDAGVGFVIQWCEEGEYTEKSFMWEKVLDSNLHIVCTLKKT